MTSATTHLTTVHRTTRYAATKKKQFKLKGDAIRPSPITSANSLALISPTPPARTMRPTSGRNLAVVNEGHLFGFYPRGVITRRRDCAPAVNLFCRLLSRPGTNLTSILFLGRLSVQTAHPPPLTKINSWHLKGVRRLFFDEKLNLFKANFRLYGIKLQIDGNHHYYFSYFATFSLLFQKLLGSLVNTLIC